ncbi:hypothetical protein D0Y65_003699 [Glycine soja]|uniref:Uncharacterized protein n=1 Tax=Glycine soja TaxID=3848 RepID=A0A445LNQ7_GLYSO|nr:hypothetical protein D0Y65_003699 [Glycine soja]
MEAEAENNDLKKEENNNDNNNNNNESNRKIGNSSECLSKPKHQMKMPFQLETLEKAYANKKELSAKKPRKAAALPDSPVEEPKYHDNDVNYGVSIFDMYNLKKLTYEYRKAKFISHMAALNSVADNDEDDE